MSPQALAGWGGSPRWHSDGLRESDPRPPPRQSPRHLRLVGVDELATRRRRRRVRLGGIIVILCITGLSFVAVAMHVVLAQNQFRLDRLSTRAAVEQVRYQQLRLEVDQLEAPQRIIAAAQGRLGMVAPPGVTYLAPATASAGEAKGAPPGRVGRAGESGLSPASPPPGWSAIKPQLTAGQ